MSQYHSYPIQSTQDFYYSRESIQSQLEQDLPHRRLSETSFGSSKQSSESVKFIEWWKIVEMANNIFGSDGWSNEVKFLKIDSIEFLQNSFYVTATSHIRIQLKDGTYHEDIGVSSVKNEVKWKAIQMAKKLAIADGMKRSLSLFGNNLGNSLRRREKRNSQLMKQFRESQESQKSQNDQMNGYYRWREWTTGDNENETGRRMSSVDENQFLNEIDLNEIGDEMKSKQKTSESINRIVIPNNQTQSKRIVIPNNGMKKNENINKTVIGKNIQQIKRNETKPFKSFK